MRDVCDVTLANDETVTATFNVDPPTCSLNPSSTVLIRSGGKRKRRKASVGTLAVRVTCNQQAGVAVDSTIIVTLAKKTKHRKARTRNLTLSPAYHVISPNVPRAMTLKVPRAALAYLARHKHETMDLNFLAHDANGLSRGSVAVRTLHMKRR
jgi:hypothetical protein